MVQSSMDFGDEVEIKVKVSLLVEDAKRQLAELGTKLTGGAAGMAGQAGAALGIGGRGANADAEPTRTKEQDDRAKVRTTALQTLAKSAPGGGLMSSMASSFKGGGIMAGMATGITAVVGILTSIMKSSQVFQTMSGTIFKIIGMMADLFLMPFVPLMMKFASWMIQHMPSIQAAGEKTVAVLEMIGKILSFGSNLTEEGKKEGGFGGGMKRIGGALTSKEAMLIAGGLALTGVTGGLAAPIGAGMVMTGTAMALNKSSKGGYAFGSSEGSGGPRMAMGAGGDLADDSRGFGNKIASWIQRFQQKEMGPGGVMERWYDEMFGGSIMPDIWGNIRGFFGGIETETAGINKRVTSDTEKLDTDRKSFWDKLKFWEYIPEIWGKVKGFFEGLGEKLKDFFTFDIPGVDLSKSASTVAACFGRAKNEVVNFFSNTIPNAARKAADGISAAATWTWGAAGTAVSFVANAFSTAGNAVWNFFSSTVPNWASSAGSAIASAARWVWGGATAAASWVGGHLETAGRAVWGFFSDTLPSWASTAGRGVATAARWVWGGVTAAASWVGGHLATAGRAVAGFFTETLPGWASSAGSVVASIASTVYNAAKSIGSWTYGGLKTAGRAIGDFFTGTLPGWASSAAGVVSGAAGNVYNAAQYIGAWTYGGLRTAGSAIGNFFTSTLPGYASTAASKVSEAVQGVGGVASWAYSYLASSMSSAVSAVSSFIGGLSSQISSAASSIRSGVGTATSWISGGRWEYGNTASNSMYEFGNSVGNIHNFGGSGGGPRRVMGVGGMSGNGGVTSNRIVNVTISSSMSIHDIVRDVERLESIQEAAFFNTV